MANESRKNALDIFEMLGSQFGLPKEPDPTVTGRQPNQIDYMGQLQELMGGTGAGAQDYQNTIGDMEQGLQQIAGMPVQMDLSPLAQFADAAGGTQYAKTYEAPMSGEEKAALLIEGRDKLADAKAEVTGAANQKRLLDLYREERRQGRFDEKEQSWIEKQVDELINKRVFRSHVADSFQSFQESMGKVQRLLANRDIPSFNTAITQIIRKVGGDVGNLSDYERRLVKLPTGRELIEKLQVWAGKNPDKALLDNKYVKTYMNIAEDALNEYGKTRLRELTRNWKTAANRPKLREATAGWAGNEFDNAARSLISFGKLSKSQIEDMFPGDRNKEFRERYKEYASDRKRSVGAASSPRGEDSLTAEDLEILKATGVE